MQTGDKGMVPDAPSGAARRLRRTRSRDPTSGELVRSIISAEAAAAGDVPASAALLAGGLLSRKSTVCATLARSIDSPCARWYRGLSMHQRDNVATEVMQVAPRAEGTGHTGEPWERGQSNSVAGFLADSASTVMQHHGWHQCCV